MSKQIIKIQFQNPFWSVTKNNQIKSKNKRSKICHTTGCHRLVSHIWIYIWIYFIQQTSLQTKNFRGIFSRNSFSLHCADLGVWLELSTSDYNTDFIDKVEYTNTFTTYKQERCCDSNANAKEYHMMKRKPNQEQQNHQNFITKKICMMFVYVCGRAYSTASTKIYNNNKTKNKIKLY